MFNHIRNIVFFLVCLLSSSGIYAEHSSIIPAKYVVSGTIMEYGTNIPVPQAVVQINELGMWAMADEKGVFVLKNVPGGKHIFSTSHAGYADFSKEISVSKDTSGIRFFLQEKNLTLSEVVITAQRKSKDNATTYVMDRTTLDHQQIINVADITGLLPGEQSRAPLSLTSAPKWMALRSGSGYEIGNVSFGTAVEVDGVRLSTNASFGEFAGSRPVYSSGNLNMHGADTRNISSTNVESVEVVTGTPSVEYGDLSNGIVKINTRKGRTPFIVDMATKPNTKQIAVSKGFGLGAKAGVLNVSAEYTKSIGDLASPYTAYDRNTVSLNYSNTFRQNKQPITLSVGMAGNIGGYNSEADPDAFRETYTKDRDNAIRGNFSLNWLLNKSWITNLEVSGSVNYADKFSEKNTNKSSSSLQPALRTTEEGYFISHPDNPDPQAPVTLLPKGYWYELSFHDSKPISYFAKVKANWSRKFGRFINKLMMGAEFTSTGNLGRGLYYDDMSKAPTWREYRFDELPFMSNTALYAEEKATLPFANSYLQATAGLRSDITAVSGSTYGVISSLSPRFNLKYTFWENTGRFLHNVSLRGAWGKAVKLPSFEMLYPRPTYADKLAFSISTYEDKSAIYAYYTYPTTPLYNPDLQWQYNLQTEFGMDAMLGGTSVSLSFYDNKTYNPYQTKSIYTPYAFNYTPKPEVLAIPEKDRVYGIDPVTGIVTVRDQTGEKEAVQLNYETRKAFQVRSMCYNATPITRRGIEWVIDFPKIRPLNTSVRVDGKYYYYRGTNESIVANLPSSPNNQYPYIGYYVGEAGYSNGDLSKQVNSNMTITTHIPAIRLIVSLRIESCFYKYAQTLSEYSGGQRSFVIDNKDSYTPSTTATNIYGGNHYTATYPLYYTSYDDMNTQIPFAEKFAWAKANDPSLYNDLAQMVVKSTMYDYIFNPDRISAYFSANISVTKEIGKHVSLSFNANNFVNTMASVTSSQNNSTYSLYGNTAIPEFYYGLSLRLKL